MLKLIGELADGSFMTAPTDFIPKAIHLVKQGAEKMGRALGSITLGNGLTTALVADDTRAKELVQHTMSYMVPATPDFVHEAIGISLDDVNLVREAAKVSLDASGRLLTPEMYENFSLRGDAETCIRTVQRWIDAGITQVGFGQPFGENRIAGIRALGEEVVSTFR